MRNRFAPNTCWYGIVRLKITKDHTIKGKEEAIAELQAAQGSHASNEMHCREHPQVGISFLYHCHSLDNEFGPAIESKSDQICHRRIPVLFI